MKKRKEKNLITKVEYYTMLSTQLGRKLENGKRKEYYIFDSAFIDNYLIAHRYGIGTEYDYDGQIFKRKNVIEKEKNIQKVI